MPYSFNFFKNEVRDWIQSNVSTSERILDVGPGIGTYSDLIRAHGYQIDAVEIFQPYIEKYGLTEKYDTVYCEDIVNFDITDYDFIILGDVLEHLSVEHAKELIDGIVDSGKGCLVAVPYEMEQGEHEGNEHETHLQSDLTEEVMKERYPELQLKFSNQYYGYYVHYPKEKVEKAYVLYANAAYFDIVSAAVKSINTFSEIPVIVYMINSDLEVPGAYKTIKWHLNAPPVEKRDYIDRKDPNTYKLLAQRPFVVADALEHYATTIAYIDSDTVVTKYIDRIFSYYPVNCTHPYFVRCMYDVLFIGQRGGVESRDELHKSLEHPACELFGVDQSVRQGYRQTGYFVAGQKSKPFIEEWGQMCIHPEVENNSAWYAPYHEESLANVLLWKYDIQEGLPMMYVNYRKHLELDNLNFTGKLEHIGDWLALPLKRNELMAFHGEKDLEEIDSILNRLKKKKVLYVAHHLSTGGMPQFLLKRVEALLDSDVDIYVIELDNYSDDYVVQKNKLKELLGDRLFLADGTDKNKRLLDVIQRVDPSVIHFEECPESMDRKLDESTLDTIYSGDRQYQIVETCHNIWMDNSKKVWHPNSYMYCTPYHPVNNFKTSPSGGTTVEYPFENLQPTYTEKDAAKDNLGFDKSKTHVLNVGLWTSGKNQGEGVEMARALELQFPGKYVFHFVGNQAGNFKEYWEPIMTNLPDNVKVWGERSDVDMFMKAADVFVFNSTWECNPLALREALSYGLITFSRNLPQYLDMYTRHINILVDDFDTNMANFIKGVESGRGSNIPKNDVVRFKNQMLNHYNQTYDGVDIMKPSVFSVSWDWQIKLHVQSIQSNRCWVRFLDGDRVVYEQDIKAGCWYSPSYKWFIPWRIEVYEGSNLIWEWRCEPEGMEIGIKFDSSSLGDSIAFMGQIKAFKEYWNFKKVWVATHKNWLFDSLEYNKLGIEITNFDRIINSSMSKINLGVFYDLDEPWRKAEHKNDWRKIHLSQIASDRLGIPLDEINARPIMHPDFRNAQQPTRDKDIVTFATASTAGAKYWHRENGWQDLINTMSEYHWVHCSKEDHVKVEAERSPEALEAVAGFMLASKFFVGISSGLTWFAWALNVPTFSISGFTPEVVEKIEGITTIQNNRVCNGCWAWDVFDKGDWNWCPAHKNTPRQFECSKEITVDQVVSKIKETMLNNNI